MRENMYAPQEIHCWEKVFGQEEICSWCSIIDLELIKKDTEKKEKHIVEFFDETDDKWLKSYDELISWPDGRAVKYSILVDITDQKEIQGSMIKSHATLAMKNKQMTVTNKKLQITKLKLQKSIGEFEQLLNATIEGILIFEDNLCKDINAQALEFFNCTNKEKLIGKKYLDFVIDDSKEFAIENFNNETSWECRLLKSDGTSFPALIKKSILTSLDIVISIIDLTELKDKENEIQEQKKMVALGELIGNIAHQWRQPLSVISACSSGMELEKEMGTLSDESLLKNCDIITKNTQYLSKTIDEFRNYIKNNDEKIIFNLSDTIDNFLHLIGNLANNNDIKIIVNVNKNIKIDGYKNHLIQCLMSIFDNAKDALSINKETNKVVFITALQEDKDIIITVKDNG